jgi:quinol monooxygenase YgiN
VARVVIFARLTANPGMRDDVFAAFAPLLETVRHEPGTLTFAMHAARDDPDVVLFYEVYADDGALAAHQGSDALQAVVPTLGPLLARPPEISYALSDDSSSNNAPM